MSFLTTLKLAELGEGREGQRAEERRVERHPQRITWDLETPADGSVDPRTWQVIETTRKEWVLKE